MEFVKKHWKKAVGAFGFLLVGVVGLLTRLLGRRGQPTSSGTKAPTPADYKAVEEGRTNAHNDFDKWLDDNVDTAKFRVPFNKPDGRPPGQRAGDTEANLPGG